MSQFYELMLTIRNRIKGGASERDRTSDLMITKGLLQRFNLLIINVIMWGAQSIVLRLGSPATLQLPRAPAWRAPLARRP